MMDHLRDQAAIGFHLDEKSIVPNDDFIWKDIIAIHEYAKKIAARCNQLQDIVEKQDIEIDKLKRHVSNRVQKVEIVGFANLMQQMMELKEKMTPEQADQFMHAKDCKNGFCKGECKRK